MRAFFLLFSFTTFLFFGSFAAGFATPQFEAPTLESTDQGFGKVVLTVAMPLDGAPNGFTIVWMEESDYIANGNQWYSEPSEAQGVASFWGVPTLNTWGGELTSFAIDPNGFVTIEVGDLFDETGVMTNWTDELTPGTDYVFVAYVNGDGISDDSPASNLVHASTQGDQDCTYTQGFWKNHPEEWPASELTLGTVLYVQSQLLAILDEPVQGNGLISMSHQLIAVELNIANGANSTDVLPARTEAHSLIDGMVVPPIGTGFLDPSVTSSTTQVLDDYNNGIIGPGHCPTAVESVSWGTVKSTYR